jgi:hypothetical protein
MALQGVRNLGSNVGADQHIDRGSNPPQAAKDVQGMMVEAGERRRGKQEVDRDAIGHRVWHVRDASGTRSMVAKH